MRCVARESPASFSSTVRGVGSALDTGQPSRYHGPKSTPWNSLWLGACVSLLKVPLYQGTARKNERRKIFLSHQDYEKFLSCLTDAVHKEGVVLGMSIGAPTDWMRKHIWFRRFKRLIAVYLIVGFAISLIQNLWGLFWGGLTAFVWTGSLKETIALLFWWFIYPALTWPVDLFWTIYHKL